MNQVLKKEWGFKGMVISDWGAVHNTVEAAWNGCDLEMGTDLGMLPNPDYNKFYFADSLIALVKAHKIPEYILDEKVRRILYVMFKTNMIDGKRIKGDYNTKQHQQTALKVAEEGIVLLKNQQNILPINNAVKSIAVIGVNADRLQSLGGGSSQVKAFYEIAPLKGIQNIAGNKINISFNPGYKIERDAKADAGMIKDAVNAAGKADIAIVVCGWTHGYDYNVWGDNAYDAESVDKPNMQMPFGQDELLKAVIKANPKTIVVIMGGGGIDMSQWIDGASGIIQSWYPGMEGGNALAKILFGQTNPSGKLPMTLPKKLEDVPAHKLGEYPGNGKSVFYFDDIFIGYRYYDTYKVEPQFPFGFGLSYTTFDYSNLKISGNPKNATATFTLSNTGKMPGAEVVQLYVKQQQSTLPRPEKELKGFDKIFLKAGEKKQITIKLNEDAFQYYNDVENKWVMEAGMFDILVGSSSRDIKLSGKLKL